MLANSRNRLKLFSNIQVWFSGMLSEIGELRGSHQHTQRRSKTGTVVTDFTATKAEFQPAFFADRETGAFVIALKGQ
jgi:hypothetical protein